MATTLCKTTDIDDPGSKGFEINTEGRDTSIFVVHKDGQFHGYINECPHTGANLEWQEDKFLDMDDALIQCATHDALFIIDSGECIAGPCVGQALTPVEIEVVGDEIHII